MFRCRHHWSANTISTRKYLKHHIAFMWVSHTAFMWVNHIAFMWVNHIAFMWVNHIVFIWVNQIAFRRVSHLVFMWVSHITFRLVNHSIFMWVNQTAFICVNHTTFMWLNHITFIMFMWVNLSALMWVSHIAFMWVSLSSLKWVNHIASIMWVNCLGGPMAKRSPPPPPPPPPFPWLSPTRDLKTGSLVATLPGTWHYRVSAGTGWAGGYPARHLALQGQCWDWLGWWLPCQAPGITGSVLGLVGLVATLPGTWHYRVSAGTGWAGGYPARHLALQGQCWDWLGWWLPCQAPGIAGSVLGLVGYPARQMASQGQCWDWLGWCPYTVTGWDKKIDLLLLSQRDNLYNCLSRSISEIQWHVRQPRSNIK